MKLKGLLDKRERYIGGTIEYVGNGRMQRAQIMQLVATRWDRGKGNGLAIYAKHLIYRNSDGVWMETPWNTQNPFSNFDEGGLIIEPFDRTSGRIRLQIADDTGPIDYWTLFPRSDPENVSIGHLVDRQPGALTKEILAKLEK